MKYAMTNLQYELEHTFATDIHSVNTLLWYLSTCEFYIKLYPTVCKAVEKALRTHDFHKALEEIYAVKK